MIEVSGVLMSWETFVMSSTFVRSDLMPSSTAILMPSRIMLSCIAEPYSGEVAGSVLTAFKSPLYIFSIWSIRMP